MKLTSKKSALFLAITSSILALILIFFMGILLGRQRAAGSETSLLQETLLLKSFEGKVALYVPPYETPKTVYNIHLANLPTLDQKRLEKGIYLADETELNLYLEDFDS